METTNKINLHISLLKRSNYSDKIFDPLGSSTQISLIVFFFLNILFEWNNTAGKFCVSFPNVYKTLLFEWQIHQPEAGSRHVSYIGTSRAQVLLEVPASRSKPAQSWNQSQESHWGHQTLWAIIAAESDFRQAVIVSSLS